MHETHTSSWRAPTDVPRPSSRFPLVVKPGSKRRHSWTTAAHIRMVIWVASGWWCTHRSWGTVPVHRVLVTPKHMRRWHHGVLMTNDYAPLRKISVSRGHHSWWRIGGVRIHVDMVRAALTRLRRDFRLVCCCCFSLRCGCNNKNVAFTHKNTVKRMRKPYLCSHAYFHRISYYNIVRSAKYNTGNQTTHVSIPAADCKISRSLSVMTSFPFSWGVDDIRPLMVGFAFDESDSGDSVGEGTGAGSFGCKRVTACSECMHAF